MFITDSWISKFSYNDPVISFYPLDIRRSISSQLQLLATLCRASSQAVSDAFDSFTTNQFLMPKMLSSLSLDAEVQALVTSFRTNLVAEQKRSINLIRLLNQINEMTTALGSNYIYKVGNDSSIIYYYIQ